LSQKWLRIQVFEGGGAKIAQGSQNISREAAAPPAPLLPAPKPEEVGLRVKQPPIITFLQKNLYPLLINERSGHSLDYSKKKKKLSSTPIRMELYYLVSQSFVSSMANFA